MKQPFGRDRLLASAKTVERVARRQRDPLVSRWIMCVAAGLLLSVLIPTGSWAQIPASPAGAQSLTTPFKLGPLTLSGSWRVRSESWDWFEDGNFTSDYTFPHSLLRLAVGEETNKVDWQFEVAQPAILALPTRAIAPLPQGQLGLGGAYFAANDAEQNTAGIFIKQAFLIYKLQEGSSLRLGRFTFLDGSEVMPHDPTLAVLDQTRVTQRLIGDFGWSAVQRSFDGIQFVQALGKDNLTVVAARTTAGVYQTDGMDDLDVGFIYGSFTAPLGGKHSPSELRLFGIGYEDPRGQVLKTDNRPLAVRTADHSDIRLGTFGADYLRVFNTVSDGRVDFLLWGALQTGSWGKQSDRAGAAVGELGWQPPSLPWKPWASAGYSYGSGDSNPNDGTHNTFFQILPTPRPYARFPFYDMENNEDVYAALNLHPFRQTLLRSEVHDLHLASANDLWYLGGGAFQPQTFGYAGRPSGGHRNLAQVWDLSFDYPVTRHFDVNFYYAKAWGGSVIQSVYPRDRNGQLGYVELNFGF